MAPADAADDAALVGDGQAQRARQVVVDALAAGAGVDEGVDLLQGQIGRRAGR